jgi:hypothetical protein
MKRFLLFCLLLCLIVPAAFSAEKKMMQVYNIRTHKYDSFPAVSVFNTRTRQIDTYPLVTIHDIQYVTPESLHVADSIQLSDDSRWMCQVSQYYLDTVVIHALVITPCAADSPEYNGITFTQRGWTMLLHDSTLSNEWTGVMVRVDSTPDHTNPADTARARLQGFDIPSRGDMVQMVIRVNEFPTVAMNSTTEPSPVLDYKVLVTSTDNDIPPPTPVSVDEFYTGQYSGGTIHYSTGERYEGSLVKFYSSPGHQLRVTTEVNTSRGTFNFVDIPSGNATSDYDESHFFTIGNGGNPPNPPNIMGDTSYHVPQVGAVIDSIKGTIATASGGENSRGYRICPLYPGDLSLGISYPTVIGHRRYPVVVTDTDIVHIQDTTRYTLGGFAIYKGILMVSLNNGSWTADTMSMITPDSVWQGVIETPDHNPLTAGTNVRYFLKGLDIKGNENILANGSTEVNGDTSKGFFFYNVYQASNLHMTIHDIQYQPYPIGPSPYNGGVVTIGGIVTACDSDIGQSVYRVQVGETGTTCYYIQSGNQPWSGIQITRYSGDTSSVWTNLLRGDSVVVTGTVSEALTVTHINDTNTTTGGFGHMTVVSHGNHVPDPVTLSTAIFKSGVGDGDPSAEPWEDMLVRFVNTHISKLHPTFADSMEYMLADTSNSGVLIRQDGINTWSNTPADTSVNRRIFLTSDVFDTLIGEVLFGNRVFKVCPRRNSDFVIGDEVHYPSGWNLLSVWKNQIPWSYGYNTNLLFPGSTAFGYNGSYTIASAMYPGSGYWIRMNGPQVIPQPGTVITKDTIPLLVGWNLVGALGVTINTSSIHVSPAGNHLSSFFGYSNGYNPTTTLTPAGGYWVKSDSVGYLALASSIIAPKQGQSEIAAFNSLTITDADGNGQSLFFVQDPEGKIQLRDYQMPPMTPVNNFSLRYASGRILETYPATITNGKTFPIDVAISHGPLKISWNIDTKEGKQYLLSDGMNGKIFKAIELKGAGTVSGIKSGIRSLMLQVNGGQDLPREFSLGRNYPNPFNPTTRFVVGLPQTAHLEVIVYDILGQKVATLVNEMRDAGYQVVEWNGTNDYGKQVSSGVYFVRMNAENASAGSAPRFTAVQKIMMMK